MNFYEELEQRRLILTKLAFKGREQLSRMGVTEQRKRLTWPSGIAKVDELAGGFYALSAVAGYQKIGKSLEGMRSGLEAAKAGWRVFCFHGENDAQTIGERLVNYFGGPYNTWPDWFRSRIVMRRINPTATWRGSRIS